MSETLKSPYKMSISLNVLDHLGLKLYSNTPAVVAEVIANAWDADANEVKVEIDTDNNIITVRDDGVGMDTLDINHKYLLVGYQKRETDGEKTNRGRVPMGRKGIGKLSLFSIAEQFEVYTKKAGCKGEAFRMDYNQIKTAIRSEENLSETIYEPERIPFDKNIDENGTIIVISELRKKLRSTSVTHLRKRVARKFGILSDAFKISINGEEVKYSERDYFGKAKYIFCYSSEDYRQYCQNLQVVDDIDPFVRPGKFVVETDKSEKNYSFGGWIAISHSSTDLRESDASDEPIESLNTISVLVRGKVAIEDILSKLTIKSYITNNIFGEISADFLDSDELEDIATTNRQSIIEEDPRHKALLAFVRSELNHIISTHNNLAETTGKEAAFSFHPRIEEWYNGLNEDHKDAAKKLFGRINKLSVESVDERRRLFISSILAFESLKLRSLLNLLETVTLENMSALKDAFLQLDDLEATAYYQSSKQRLEVINTLTKLVTEDAKEKFIQEHLHSHLWLLDPSWERGAVPPRMETSIAKAFEESKESLSDEEKSSRLDIYHTIVAKKHVIIELKRYSASLRTDELYKQISKYRAGVRKALNYCGKDEEPLEIICIIGKNLLDWADPDGESVSRKSLSGLNARIINYDELITSAEERYSDYLESSKPVGSLYELVVAIEKDDATLMGSSE